MERRGGGDPTKTAEWLDVRATRSGPSSDKHHLVVGAKGSGDNGLRTLPQSTYTGQDTWDMMSPHVLQRPTSARPERVQDAV
jgi:hypothetical protein